VDGQAVAGRFTQAHVAGDDAGEHLTLKVLLYLVHYLEAQVGAGV